MKIMCILIVKSSIYIVSLKEPEFLNIKGELEESFHRAHEGRTNTKCQGENVSEKWKNVSLDFGFIEFDSVNTAANVCMDLHNGCEGWKSKYDEETGMGFSLQVEFYLNAQGLRNEF